MKCFPCLTAFLLSIFFSGSCLHAATLTYQPIVNLSTGIITPHYFAVGDFNADGKPDLAVPDFGGNTLSVYLNQGGGSFSAPVVSTVSITAGLEEILSGDFNGDGKADLVVSSLGSGVFVLLGNGDGTFSLQPAIPGSFNFISGKVADFNGDGHQDLFLGGDGIPYLFLGKGDGSFSQGTVGTGSGQYGGVSAGDFNGDKKLDAIAVDADLSFIGGLQFFPGDGSGSLGNATVAQLLFQNPVSVDVADLNHDGKLDLLIAGNGAAGGILGNGDGTFQIADSQVIPIYAESQVTNTADGVAVLAADLNQDGYTDAVVLDGTIGLLSLSLNDGTGAFPPTLNTPYTYQFTANGFSVAAADFNGDGLPDIVVSNGGTKTISLLLSIKPLVKPTISLTSSSNSVLVGTALTFKAAITGGSATATGTVSLLDGSTQLAQQTLDGSGDAVFNVSSLTTGVRTLTLSYSGDTNYAAGTSAAVSESVTDFQVALTASSQTVTAGSTASYPLTVTPQAGFTGEVSFSCSGLPSLATCTAPALTVGASAARETITISTTAATTAANRMPEGAGWACVLVGCFSLCGLRLKNGTSAKWLSMVLLTLMFGAMGCGGSAKRTVPGTPSGTSTITITAAATQNGVTVTHASTATLIVQ